MDKIGNTYFYEYKGIVKSGKLISKTKAWFIFDNGDWIRSYSTLYNSKEELVGINSLVDSMYKNTYIPDVVHLPNAFTR